jgi:hypothetical protein
VILILSARLAAHHPPPRVKVLDDATDPAPADELEIVVASVMGELVELGFVLHQRGALRSSSAFNATDPLRLTLEPVQELGNRVIVLAAAVRAHEPLTIELLCRDE